MGLKNMKELGKPSVVIICGVGINCEEETAFAFKKAGFNVIFEHLNDFIKNANNILKEVHVLAFPGGFAYADIFGSGTLVASKIMYLYPDVFQEITRFIEKGNLVIGICNGCQILSHLCFDNRIELLPNNNRQYICRWEECVVDQPNNSVWLQGIERIRLPIAHGEGRFHCSNDFLKVMKDNNMIALRYVNNPNGSVDNIAAISDKTGRVLLIMPHPERAILFSHDPDFCLHKESLKRMNNEIPNDGDGSKIFANAFAYFL